MNKIFSFKLIFLLLFLSINIYANEVFKGLAKQDVNVRSLPDYESKVAYVLRKNDEVNIQAIIKTKNKGTWYKIDNGYVVVRFVNTQAQDIPNENYNPLLKTKEPTTKEKIQAKLEEEPKKVEVEKEAKKTIETTKEIIKEDIQENTTSNQAVVEDIQETKEEDLTSQIKPMIEENDEASSFKREDRLVEKTFVEPTVIKKEESFFSKYINIDYVIYTFVGIIILVLLIVIIGKLFSRPSISDQISQHQRRNESLKKALSKEEQEE